MKSPPALIVPLAAALAAALVAGCAAPTDLPTPSAAPPTPTQPFPMATPSNPAEPTLDPHEPVSATPLPPGSSPEPGPTPAYNPAPGDELLQRDEVFIDSTGMVVAESFPPQYFVSIRGSLPTPCHHLRATVSAPDEAHRITIEVYSLADPNIACIQVLEPFDINVRLGSLPAGTYEVWVNGQPIGQIDAP